MGIRARWVAMPGAHGALVVGDGVVAECPFGVEQHDVGAREERDERRDKGVGRDERRTPVALGNAGRDAPPRAIEVGAEGDVAAGTYSDAIAGESEEQRGSDLCA